MGIFPNWSNKYHQSAVEEVPMPNEMITQENPNRISDAFRGLTTKSSISDIARVLELSHSISKVEAWRNFLKDGGGGFFEDQRVRKDLKLKTFPESKKSLMISMEIQEMLLSEKHWKTKTTTYSTKTPVSDLLARDNLMPPKAHMQLTCWSHAAHPKMLTSVPPARSRWVDNSRNWRQYEDVVPAWINLILNDTGQLLLFHQNEAAHSGMLSLLAICFDKKYCEKQISHSRFLSFVFWSSTIASMLVKKKSPPRISNFMVSLATCRVLQRRSCDMSCASGILSSSGQGHRHKGHCRRRWVSTGMTCMAFSRTSEAERLDHCQEKQLYT